MEIKHNPKVNFFFDKTDQWQQAYDLLRSIALESGLREELKWGCPCYTLNDSNIVLIHGFKDYCAYLFFKGAILDDPEKLLIWQTENVQAARQIRFTSVMDIVGKGHLLKAYIQRAIEVEKAGLKVELKKTTEFKMPEEFKTRLEAMPALQEAFEKLTPGRQRAYLLHFSSAKQVKTRIERIEKYLPKILAGKGLEDE